MATQPVTPWNVLSGAIRSKIDKIRDKAEAQKEQERQTEYKAWDGVLTNPNSTEEERASALEHLRKQVPKEAIPIVEGYHKVVDAIHKVKKGKQQSGQPGQSSAAPAAPVSPSASKPATGTPAAPSASPISLPQALSGINDPRRAVAAQTAQEGVLQKSRQQTVDALRQKSVDPVTGESSLDKDEGKILDIWAATGAFPPAALVHSKRHPVTIEDPDPSGKGGLIPAMEDENGVVWANGQEVQNPKVMPKWKPRTGWTKTGPGKFMSFSIDPATNQPIPGTESTANLPPSAYLDKVREGVYHWTDDSGNVHESPFTTRSFANVPANVTGKNSTPAVPPGLAKLPQAKSTTGAASTSDSKGKGTGAKGERILGTKDTGVLSPVAQRALIQIEPVANQAKRLEKIFDDHPELKENNQAGYLLLPYIAYRLGYAKEGALEEEIAGLSLGSVIDAASVLQGTSRSISALRLAMVHTPNAKVDSPKQIYRKLHNDIIPRLDDVMTTAKRYGTKRATAAGTNGAGAVPKDMKAPPTDADAAAAKWLQEHP